MSLPLSIRQLIFAGDGVQPCPDSALTAAIVSALLPRQSPPRAPWLAAGARYSDRMAETKDDGIRVFISWSGPWAKEVARALHSGINETFDAVTPFMSDSDIGAGQRGLAVIEKELQSSSFGIIVVTPENMHEAWLNFEAGALSKALDTADHRVVPLLVGISGTKEWTGPLTQFQARHTSRKDVADILAAIGKTVGVEAPTIDRRMDSWWPDFGTAVTKAGESMPVAPQRSVEDMLEELLQLARDDRRESFLPAPLERGEDVSQIMEVLNSYNLPGNGRVSYDHDRYIVRLPVGTSHGDARTIQNNLSHLGFKAVVTVRNPSD